MYTNLPRAFIKRDSRYTDCVRIGVVDTRLERREYANVSKVDVRIRDNTPVGLIADFLEALEDAHTHGYYHRGSYDEWYFTKPFALYADFVCRKDAPEAQELSEHPVAAARAALSAYSKAL